jgi:hypothetical protein
LSSLSHATNVYLRDMSLRLSFIAFDTCVTSRTDNSFSERSFDDPPLRRYTFSTKSTAEIDCYIRREYCWVVRNFSDKIPEALEVHASPNSRLVQNGPKEGVNISNKVFSFRSPILSLLLLIPGKRYSSRPRGRRRRRFRSLTSCHRRCRQSKLRATKETSRNLLLCHFYASDQNTRY